RSGVDVLKRSPYASITAPASNNKHPLASPLLLKLMQHVPLWDTTGWSEEQIRVFVSEIVRFLDKWFPNAKAIKRESAISPDADEFQALYVDLVRWRITIPGTRTLFSQEEIGRSFEVILQMVSDPDAARFYGVRRHRDAVTGRAIAALQAQHREHMADLNGIIQRAIDVQNQAHRKQRLRSLGEVLTEAEIKKRQSLTQVQAAAALE